MIAKIKRSNVYKRYDSLEGNSRAMTRFHALFSVPYNLFWPLMSVYMIAIGLSEIQVGFVITISLFFQFCFAFFGGVLCDKYGRKKTYVVAEIITWVLAGLLWATAQNFYWFLIGYFFNSCVTITSTCHNNLFAEDTPPEKLPTAYTLIYSTATFTIFFSPVVALLIRRFSLIPIMRILILIFIVLVCVKLFLMYKLCEETTNGKRKVLENKDRSFFSLFLEYRVILKKFFTSKAAVTATLIAVMIQITQVILVNYYPVYITQELNNPDYIMAILPMIKLSTMMFFYFYVNKFISRYNIKIPMVLGIGSYIISILILIFAPNESIAILFVYILFDAMGFAFLMPNKDALVASSLDMTERARFYSISIATIMLLCCPFGFIGGVMYSLNPVLPFLFVISLFVVILLVVLKVNIKKSN